MAAIGLLVGMFLMSRAAPSESDLSFLQGTLRDSIGEQRIGAPYFSAKTNSGDQISLSARTVKPVLSNPSVLTVEQVTTRIVSSERDEIIMSAGQGLLDTSERVIMLQGGAQLVSMDGYQVSATEVIARLDENFLSAKGPIYMTGPGGQIQSGHMEISRASDSGTLKIVFTEGVKLLYDPK